jgi:hypothetical protein
MQVEISKPHNKSKKPAPKVQKHSKQALRSAKPKSGSFTSKSVHNSYNKQSRDIGVFFYGGVVVGELGRPIVGLPRSADRLKKLAHNSNSNNRKNPNQQQQQKYAITINQSINGAKKERKNQRSSTPSLLFCNPPSSQGAGIGDVGHRYVGTYFRGTYSLWYLLCI